MPRSDLSPAARAKGERKRSDNARAAMSSTAAFVQAERVRNARRTKIDDVPVVALRHFRCERWACWLSPFACSLRWAAAQGSQRRDARGNPAEPYARCKSCAIGEANHGLVQIRKDGAK
jgi:hypothetical protein